MSRDQVICIQSQALNYMDTHMYLSSSLSSHILAVDIHKSYLKNKSLQKTILTWLRMNWVHLKLCININPNIPPDALWAFPWGHSSMCKILASGKVTCSTLPYSFCCLAVTERDNITEPESLHRGSYNQKHIAKMQRGMWCSGLSCGGSSSQEWPCTPFRRKDNWCENTNPHGLQVFSFP